MAPLDWGKVLSADPVDLSENEDAAEEMLAYLDAVSIDADMPDASDPTKMVHLFQVAHAISKLKNSVAVVALEEANQAAEKEQELQHENNILQRENDEYRKHAGAGSDDFMREIQRISNQNRVLEQEVQEKDEALFAEKNKTDKLGNKLEELERENRNLKRDVDRARTDSRDLQKQIEQQRESMAMNRGGADTYKSAVAKKNKELSEYLDELKMLQETNEELEMKLDESKRELEAATTEMDKIADEYTKLKTILQQSDLILEEMRRERDALRAQVQDLRVQVSSKTDADDEIMMAVNVKVEEWKAVLVAKDIEIEQYKDMVNGLQQRIRGLEMDTDSTTMALLQQAIVEKDDQIQMLKSELEKASTEMQGIAAQVDEVKSQADKGVPSAYQQKKILELGSTLRREQMLAGQERERMLRAEEAARQKDKELSDLMVRMVQYEKGEYGLSEAVQEIKDHKAQLQIRDQNIESLTASVNKLSLAVNDLEMENEELRERLGMDPRDRLDIEEIKQKRKVKKEQSAALNRVLVKEIERLEEERVNLKKQLRKQALHRGERAVELGITADDLVDVEDEPDRTPVSRRFVIDSDTEEARSRNKRLEGDIEKKEKEADKITTEMKKFERENKELKEENKQLEIGMREILAQLRENSQRSNEKGGGDTQSQAPPARDTQQTQQHLTKEAGSASQAFTVQVPALEKLMAMIESRNAAGQYDTTLHLKAQIDQLTGRNEELRHELTNARNETSKALVQVERRETKIEQLQEEVKALKEIGEGAVKLQALPLPEGMTPSSSEIIASLNEHLIYTLQELTLKEELLGKMEKDLETYRRKFSVVIHQQGLLYDEYNQKKQEWEKESQALDEARKAAELAREQDTVRIKEFERLLETLSCDPDKQQKRLAELTRKITVLRVNEKSLTRRYTAMQEVESALRKENKKMNSDIVEMETAISEKLGYLQRHKEMSTYKMHALQQALDESVPSKDLEAANKQYNELTSKYRDLLQRENTLVSRSVAVDSLEADVKILREHESELKKEMTSLKERNHNLEQMLNELLAKDSGQQTVGESSPARQEEINRISRKLATLEMKELNERERADHASRKYEQLKKVFNELEERNAELEQKFAEIGQLNLDAQRIERQLREELEGAVTHAMHESVVKRLQVLEESEARLKVEESRLKEVAEVAAHQAESLKSQQDGQERELMALRKQLYDVQMESDEKTIIGKLHHHIVALQVSEGTAVRKLEAATHKVSKLEAQILRLEQKIDEKDQILYHSKTEARNKAKFLKRTIQDLRRQYSGALPLMKQEKFANTMRALHEDKANLKRDLRKVTEDRLLAEDKLSELELKHRNLEELIATLKDGKGAAKVTEWHAKMNEIRLQDLKLNRTIDRMKEQCRFLENLNKQHERTISDYEDDIVQMTKHHEERQLLWEQREVELERMIDRFEKQQSEVMNAAQKFEEATGSLPDPSLPVANQLELAVRKIREHIRVIISTREENNRLRKKVEEAEQALKQSEERLTQKDKVINELRLRLPISERDEVTATAQKAARQDKGDEYQAKQALKVAQTTVSSLQQMLARKEESLSKYQEMLREARDEAQSQAEQHKAEIQLLQDRLHLESDEVFKRTKLMHQESVSSTGRIVPTENELRRLGELEETVAEQDNALAVAAEKYKRSREELSQLRREHDDTVNTLKQDYKRKKDQHEKQIKKLQEESNGKDQVISERDKEIEVLKEELEVAKEANERAPTRTMKALVERLRNQLALKEKQQKSLSQALLQLRADMVTTAEENVQIHAKKAEQEVNVQHVVEKETSSLQSRIEELQSRMEKLKRELKRQKEKESTLQGEKERLKEQLAQKDSAINKLGVELKELHEIEQKLDGKAEELAAEKRKATRATSEADKLREKVKSLQEQLKVQRAEGEVVAAATVEVEGAVPPSAEISPRDEDRGTKTSKRGEEVARWEEGKKWHKKVETLREKLSEKTKELEKAEKTISMLREAVNRGEKDKTGLQSRLRSAARVGSTAVTRPPPDDFIQELKHKIFTLEEENQDLRRQQTLGHDRQMEALQLRNDQLQDAVQSLENELSQRVTEQRSIDQADAGMYRDLHQKNQSLQQQLLEARQENMELRFDYEQARKENPRLKARVEDLQEYVEILKAELESSKKREKARKKSLGTGLGGQSVEDMERVLAAMRRVVERLQGENEQLKKTAGAGAPQYTAVLKENTRLKHEIDRLKATPNTAVSGSATDRKNTGKLMTENERLRKELKKEKEESEKLRVATADLESTKASLVQELEQAEVRLSGTNLQGMDSKEWKSVVLPKVYEEKVQKLQAELEKKTNLLKDIKAYLKAAAQRETELLKKQQELEETIDVLERFPSDVQGDRDLVKELQRTRLRLATVESEKDETITQMRELRRMAQAGELPNDLDKEEVLDKVKNYNKMVADDVELRTKLKTVELERDRLSHEVTRLQKELEAFDPAFFEEIEDLKYNYKKAVERNVLYERQLKNVSKQFGVDVNIQTDD
ncbi:centrosomal protein of 290 kDa isoform X2 [Nematostella vectensis]|uniref:centrosomal protein of 290 kDa isoform X2 n=1 Tax=Nematostella vectensis TaxID=45351 RepID=UPI0020776A97|nr:centrosomal protein of 290 kDa isoform X2 [Nematostella vectensis]